ncbi:MAG: glycoside hydrolase family 13 protein [Arcicella sp.]|jgi:glycosidase|nr:glycoside hydrolase family 13 protein [Arcicella sp.]
MKNAIIKATVAVLFILIHNPVSCQHIEPLNWWVGMKNPSLQLMVHQEGIGETEPSIDYQGVRIKKVNKADSKNYLFIDLEIAANTKVGTFKISFKKDGKMIHNFQYSLLPRKQESPQFKGFNSADVIYLIVPDRFANGNYNNDVVAGMLENKIDRKFEGARHGGDIRGIINNLDYIAAMGYTAIWMTPILENNMKSYSYHGYSITNHYKVDPRYGTLDEYVELATKAKQKGIKLIYDEVLNHIGSNYWWMNDLPFKNWLNYPESYQPTNHRRTVNQDRYASEFDKGLMAKGWFDKTMPDMNGQNLFMENYLIQNSIWWTETLQLGGIRQDTYGYSDKNMLKKWSCRLMDEYPNFNIVGEEWSINPLITSYWQRGKKNVDNYDGCLPSIMDFPLQSALVEALNEKDATKGLTNLYEALANDFVYADPQKILVMGDNHDMDRIFTQLNEDIDLTKMALTYLLTTRGIPQIYYGTEILMENTGHHKNDGLIRSDFPGGWQEDLTNGFTGQGLSNDKKQMQSYLKQLLNWRKQNPVIATGKLLHFAPNNGTYVYFRYNSTKTVMIVMNKNTTATILEPSRFSEILKSKIIAKNIFTNEQLDLKKGIDIAPKSTLVFEIE